MRHFRSILLAACVALLDAPWGCEGAMIPPYNNSAHAADCTDAFNAARAAAGLAPLKKSSRPMLDQSLQELYTHCRLACAGLQPGFMPADQLGIQGTLIFSPQQGPEGDCDAAVSYLKKGHRWFGSVPPVFHRFGEAPYDKFQTVGFVGLYNPKEDADIDCAYFTCYGFEGLEEVPKSVHRGFMCITNPLALQEGEAPFSNGGGLGCYWRPTNGSSGLSPQCDVASSREERRETSWRSGVAADSGRQLHPYYHEALTELRGLKTMLARRFRIPQVQVQRGACVPLQRLLPLHGE
ncbi:hypothetical protein Emag_001810 [Eimeria magna]